MNSPEGEPEDTGDVRSRSLRPALFPAVLVGVVLIAASILGRLLLPFILGGLLALIFAPIHQSFLNKRFRRGTAAAYTAGLANVTAFLFIAGLAWFLVAIAQALLTNLPDLWSRLLDRAADLAPSYALSGLSRQPPAALSDPLAALGGEAGSLALSLVSITGSAVSLTLLVILTPFVTFYLLRDGGVIIASLAALISDRHEEETRRFLSLAKERLLSALGGQLLISLIQTVIYAAGYLVVGLNWALALAVLAGFGRLIPVLGGIATFIIAAVVALLQFDSWLPLAAIAGVHLLVEIVEITVLIPVIIGSRTQIHPLLVISTVLVGTALFGILGMIIAIPLAAALGVLLEPQRNRADTAE